MDTTFEVNKIVGDKLYRGESYYCVEWKNTKTNNIGLYSYYKNEIERVIKINKKTYIIEWKTTWMKFEELKDGCDEILGAYLLLKLYNYS